MSQENVETVRRGFELWSAIVRGDGDERTVAEWLSGYTPDARIDFSATAFDLPPDASVEDMVRWIFRQSSGSLQEVRIERGQLRAVGDSVVMPVRLRGRGVSSGVPVDMSYVYVFGMREGKVAFAKTYHSLEEALEAVGRDHGFLPTSDHRNSAPR